MSTSVFFSNSCSPTLTMSRFMRLSSMAMGDWSSSSSASNVDRAADARRSAPRLDPGGDGVMGAVNAGDGGTAGWGLGVGSAVGVGAGSLRCGCGCGAPAPAPASGSSCSPKSTVHMRRGLETRRARACRVAPSWQELCLLGLSVVAPSLERKPSRRDCKPP